jgi:quercetin dioxygenase-like cupin family protein
MVLTTGRINVGFDASEATLGPGDRLSFPADHPHHYYAVGGPAKAILALDYR